LFVYLLLSSSKRKRYREDILRCLAAPIGARIQFRYAKHLVAPSIINDLLRLKGQTGIVCNVDLEVVEGPCPLVPVRAVTIQEVRRLGSTISLVLQTDEFAYGSRDEFTEELTRKAGGLLPILDEPTTAAEASRGYFLLQISDLPSNLTLGKSLEQWERVVGELCQNSDFNSEPFFWTVLDLYKGEPTDPVTQTFQTWPDEISSATDYMLLLYLFHPKRDTWNAGPSCLTIESSFNVNSFYPRVMAVDCPYDLKRWIFSTEPRSTVGPERGWIRIGPTRRVDFCGEGNEESQAVLRTRCPVPDWDILLPLSVKPRRFITAVVLVGLVLSLALPGIGSLVAQTPIAIGLHVVGSVVTAALVFFGVRRKGP